MFHVKQWKKARVLPAGRAGPRRARPISPRNCSRIEVARCNFPTTFHVERHLPIQNRAKISPSRSSAVNSPVIKESGRWARRNSSAKSSRRAVCRPPARRVSAPRAAPPGAVRAPRTPSPGPNASPHPQDALRASRSTPAPVLPKATPTGAFALFRARNLPRQVDLVHHADPRNTLREALRDRAVRVCLSALLRRYLQHSVGTAERNPRPLDSDPFHRVARVPQAGGIDDVQRNAVQIDRCRIASRVVPGMSVTIARSSPARRLSRLDLPTFGLPASTTCSPSRRDSPLAMRSRARLPSARLTAARRSLARHSFRKSTLLLREIERRFDEHAQLGDRLDDQFSSAAENSPCSERIAAARSLRARRIDQIDDALGLSQVELVVEERALREFARLGETRAQLEAPRQQAACSTTGPPWPCSSRTSSPV